MIVRVIIQLFVHQNSKLQYHFVTFWISSHLVFASYVLMKVD